VYAIPSSSDHAVVLHCTLCLYPLIHCSNYLLSFYPIHTNCTIQHNTNVGVHELVTLDQYAAPSRLRDASRNIYSRLGGTGGGGE
jgi:hypothetical protein